LLELIVAMVSGTRTRATPCEWPKLEVEDGRLSAVVNSAAAVDSGWAVELLLRSAVPRLMRREAVEMVEAVVEAVPGCPAAARLAVAMLRICCGEGSNERGSVEVAPPRALFTRLHLFAFSRNIQIEIAHTPMNLRCARRRSLPYTPACFHNIKLDNKLQGQQLNQRTACRLDDNLHCVLARNEINTADSEK
jgi:hypothetical protein